MGKGFPAFPLIFFFFFNISVLYLLLIAYGKARRREEKKGTSLQGRKERRYCERVLSLAGGTAILWDVGFPAPRAALLLCHSQWGLLQERLGLEDNFWQRRAAVPGCAPLSSSTDSVNN